MTANHINSYNCNYSYLECLIEKYPNKNWNYRYLSANTSVSQRFIEKHRDKNWDLYWMSIPNKVDTGFIERNSCANFVKYGLSVYDIEIPAKVEYRVSVKKINNTQVNDTNLVLFGTLDEINKKIIMKGKRVDWYNFSRNENVSLTFIKNTMKESDSFLGKAFNYMCSSSSSYEWKWDWKAISSRTDLTPEFIEDNIGCIHFGVLSQNNSIDENMWYYSMRKKYTTEQLSIFREELVRKSWDPRRYKKWCIEHDNRNYNIFKACKEELIQISWHPDRFVNWCLDTDERKSVERFNTFIWTHTFETISE